MKIVNYEKSFGEYKFPEGFEELLSGRSIEEQMAFFRTTSKDSYTVTGWRERTYSDGYYKLDKSMDVLALIVDDGKLVGVMVENENGKETPCFPEEYVCTYYSEDNNGAGYKTRAIFLNLLCVGENFDK